MKKILSEEDLNQKSKGSMLYTTKINLSNGGYTIVDKLF